MKIKEILKKELEKIKLSFEEYDRLIKLENLVRLKLKKNGFDSYLGGSLAKGTIISKDNQDIDIFVVLRDESDLKRFNSVLKKIDFGYELRLIHGSRDYFKINFEKTSVELIPIVQVNDPKEAKNITDISLFHVDYVNKIIKKNPMIADEIKLAKAFCIANDFYGAESYIKGFSGYSLEVLTIYYGSFLNLLKKIGTKKVIDPERLFKNEKEVMFELNSSKLQGPLIVVDPTYKYRNVCAGLGKETFDRFLELKNKFLKKPSVDFFKSKKIDVDNLKKISIDKNLSLYKVYLKSDRQEGDIAGTKCRKFLDFFCDELEKNGQKIFRKEFSYFGGKDAQAYIFIKECQVINVRGPPLKLKREVSIFKKRHKVYYQDSDYIYYKKKVSIKRIFKESNRVKEEMGAWGNKLERLFDGKKKK
jgi:tRNA nucleotidyltransferase (CCA-adding enzyme)